MPKDTIASGRVLAERYRLDELLGEGGFGTVWRGQHLVLEAPVAVKLIDPEIAQDEVAVERFLREAKAAASLRSPHVVQIFDYGVDDGQPFIAMELLEGETLAQRLKRTGRLSAAEAVHILGHVARAIGRAHEAGVVHRDLKPENVFLVHNDDDEVAKVLDFGVAKLDASKLGVPGTATRTGSLLGTPFYMSPEQVLGNKEVDFRSDLWSIGVIAFEMLTGRRPFVSDGLGDLVLQITVKPLPVPSQLAPVPSGFDDWFERTMAREPSGRLASARDLVETLREALEVGADSVDAVVTVPEPGEEPPAALQRRVMLSPSRANAPTRRVSDSTAPTVSAAESEAAAAATSPGEHVAVTPERRMREARGRGETATVSQFTSPTDEPQRRGRGTGVALLVAGGALAIGLGAGLLALRLREPERPLPTVAATAALPRPVNDDAHLGHVAALATASAALPPTAASAAVDPVASASAAPGASASAGGIPSAEGIPSAAPMDSASATAPTTTDPDAPPPEWLPREVNGRIVKPAWAQPEPEPPPPEENTPYD